MNKIISILRYSTSINSARVSLEIFEGKKAERPSSLPPKRYKRVIGPKLFTNRSSRGTNYFWFRCYRDFRGNWLLEYLTLALIRYHAWSINICLARELIARHSAHWIATEAERNEEARMDREREGSLYFAARASCHRQSPTIQKLNARELPAWSSQFF